MNVSHIQPYIRYAHYLPIRKDSEYKCVIPYDHRFFYMYDGVGTIKTDAESYVMNKGDVLIIPSGRKYQLLPTQSNAIYIALNFDFTQSNIKLQKPIPPTETERFNRQLILENANITNMSFFNDITYIRGMNTFSAKLIRIEQEFSQKLLYFENIISNTLAEILWECTRVQCGQNYTFRKEFANVIIGYINENFNKPLSNKQIGEAFNLHPNYISRIIKDVTGIPLHQYILQIRIHHSTKLLTESKYTLSEIAEMCGFCDIYHYSKSFKKIIGVPPSAYL